MTVKDCNNSTKQQTKLSLRLFLAVGVLLLTPVGAISLKADPKHIIFNEDFENGSLNEWGKELIEHFEGRKLTRSGKEVCCKHSVEIVNSPTREGRYAAKFTLHKDDPDVAKSRRAELRLNAVPTKSEYWYGFSNYLPDDFVKDRSYEIVSQWHARPDSDLGESWRSPQLTLAVYGDKWRVSNRWDPKKVTQNNNPRPEGGAEGWWVGKIEKEKWTDWVFHVKWSYQSDGLIEVWKDGKLVVRKTGPNTYNDEVGPFQKLGIYKPDWKERPHKSKTTKRVLYYDNVRMGTTSARYKNFVP